MWRACLLSALFGGVVAAALTFLTVRLLPSPTSDTSRPGEGGQPRADKNTTTTDKKEVESQWAKEVTKDFLDAALGGNQITAELLLTEEFRRTAKDRDNYNIPSPYKIAYSREHRVTWSINSEAIAPDQDEAVFRSNVQYDGNEWELTVRVIKEKVSGKWRVSFYNLAPLPKAEDKSRK